MSPSLGDVIAKLLRRAGIAKKREFTGHFEDEQSTIEYVVERLIGGRVTLVTFGFNRQHADDGLVVPGSDDDLGNCVSRPYVDETSIWFEPTTGATQGIDHALDRQSSQRPGQQHDVGGLLGNVDAIDRIRTHFDAALRQV